MDGAQNTDAINAAHHWLVVGVGFAFVIGFGVALAIYRNGLGLAERIKRAVGPLHTVLEKGTPAASPAGRQEAAKIKPRRHEGTEGEPGA